MRAVKILVAAMGVLIVAGMGLLIYGVMQTSGKLGADKASPPPPPPASASATAAPASSAEPFGAVALGEPEGSHIAHMTSDGQGRLLLGVSGGGQPDRVLVIDATQGRRLGTIGLGPSVSSRARDSVPPTVPSPR